MSTSTVNIRIGLILSSIRQGRRGEGFARWIHRLVAARDGVEVEWLDLREYPLPGYAYEQTPALIDKTYTDATARRWSEKIYGLDGYVVVTPEYNHGYPGQLKNAIDHVQVGWWYKPMAFVSYGGTAGGARAVESLRNVAAEVRMVSVRTDVNIRLIGLAKDDAGQPTDPLYAKRAAGMIDELLWWARATRRARVEEPPPGV